VVPIDIPPLRDHKEDIPDLVNHFLARFAAESEKPVESITRAALDALSEYHWPGNVRQLENVVERAVALTSEPVIDVQGIHLDATPGKAPASAQDNFLPEGMTLEQWEDNMIREALRRANGNKSQAARLLGLSRNALRYRLGKIGVVDDE
jgi:DNA-binding NtrC family response regulator